MKKKKVLFIILLIILILISMLILYMLKMQDCRIIASKKINNGEVTFTYNIDLNENKVEKIYKYKTKEIAKNEYLQYENTNKFLTESEKIIVENKGKKVIIEIPFDKFYSEIGLNKENIDSMDYVKTFLEEKGFNTKTTLGAKRILGELQKIEKDLTKEEKESEIYQKYKEEYIEFSWSDKQPENTEAE